MAMGNTIVGGGYPVNFSTATNCRFEYNTVVVPYQRLLRILNEGSPAWPTIGRATAITTTTSCSTAMWARLTTSRQTPIRKR